MRRVHARARSGRSGGRCNGGTRPRAAARASGSCLVADGAAAGCGADFLLCTPCFFQSAANQLGASLARRLCVADPSRSCKQHAYVLHLGNRARRNTQLVQAKQLWALRHDGLGL